MTIKTIDDAIAIHRSWVVQFQAAAKGIHREVFDLTNVKDETACEFGQWLMSDRSREKLGQEMHQQVSVEHSTFHAFAGEIVEILHTANEHEHLQRYMTEFDSHSKSLAALMQSAKTKI